MLSALERGRREHSPRGGGFLLFLVVLMPLTLIGVVLSADYTRVLLAKRQATNTADVIAMAAATAIVEDAVAGGFSVRIEEEEARRRAQELFARATGSGMLPANLDAELTDVRVVQTCVITDGTCEPGREVTVSIKYRVPSLIVVRAVTPDAETELGGTVSRSAQICDPADPPTAAGCAYPVGG